MPTTATAPSLIDDAEFLTQLDALDRLDPDADRVDEAGQKAGDDREPRANGQAPPRERSRPFWEERMREGAVAFNEVDDPEPAVPPAGISRAAAALGLMFCTAAGAGAAALVFHERLAHLLR